MEEYLLFEERNYLQWSFRGTKLFTKCRFSRLCPYMLHHRRDRTLLGLYRGSRSMSKFWCLATFRRLLVPLRQKPRKHKNGIITYSYFSRWFTFRLTCTCRVVEYMYVYRCICVRSGSLLCFLWLCRESANCVLTDHKLCMEPYS